MGVRDRDEHQYADGLYAILEHYGWSLREPRSGWYTIKCEAHKDSHASCRVSFDVGQIFCQACDLHGDAISVIQHYDNLGFLDAVRKYEEVTGSKGTLLRGAGRGGASVPRGPRDRSGDRAYVPPRSRQR